MNHQNVVCFAGEDWWYHNPHSNKHIMESLAKSRKVLFVNSIGVRMPDFKSDKQAWKRIFSKFKSLMRYLRQPQTNLYVLTPVALPLFRGKEELVQKINKRLLVWQINWLTRRLKLGKPIYWVCVPTVYEVVKALKQKLGGSVAYYCVDNIAEFEGANQEYIANLDRNLHDYADVAIYVNTDLYAERKQTKLQTFYLPHGVDYEHFAQCQTKEFICPSDLGRLNQPIIGYMGIIKGIDFKLIRFLAERNPLWSFVFVGAVYSGIEEIADLPNVHFIGRRNYEELPRYLSVFDCCCLYYRTDNDFDNYRNPKKLMEYFATGKPIVSMSNLQMNYYRDYVYVADSYEEFDTYLHQVIDGENQQMTARRIDLAQTQTWDAVAQQAMDYIENPKQEAACDV